MRRAACHTDTFPNAGLAELGGLRRADRVAFGLKTREGWSVELNRLLITHERWCIVLSSILHDHYQHRTARCCAKPHRQSHPIDQDFLSPASMIAITGCDVIRGYVVANGLAVINSGPRRRMQRLDNGRYQLIERAAPVFARAISTDYRRLASIVSSINKGWTNSARHEPVLLDDGENYRHRRWRLTTSRTPDSH